MHFWPHYTKEELVSELDALQFPEHFWFGTSTSGYQSEGGHNGSDDPKNNWYYAEAQGRVERTGAGSRFWDLFKEDMECAALMGCNGFRMGLEWSRIQPEYDPESRNAPGFDTAAIDRYAEMIAYCQKLSMMPAITLFHWTSPLWMGTDAWLDRKAVLEPFLQYVEHAVIAINKRLVEVHGTEPVPYWITMNEPAAMPLGTYLGRLFPAGKGRGGRADFLASFENILLAHILTYEKVHEIYRRHGWNRPTVTINPWASGVYASDLMLLDILMAPAQGMERENIYNHLHRRKQEFYQRTAIFPHKNRQGWPQKTVEWVFTGMAQRVFGKQPFPNLVEAVYTSSSDMAPWLDVMSFDFYDPFPGNYVETSLFSVRVRSNPWEWGVSPDCLGEFLHMYHQTVHHRPIHILENGMAYAYRNGRAETRRDGAQRIQVLKAHLFECIQAMNRGIPIQAFFYWTLFDNYEWGSFIPRFGMLHVDYDNGSRRQPTDAVGNNVAGAYQAIIRAFQAKDKDALREAFLAEEYPLLF